MERRTLRRTRSTFPVELCKGTDLIPALVVDVSPKGIGIISKAPLYNSLFELKLKIPKGFLKDEELGKLRAYIVWEKEGQGGQYLYGMCFLENGILNKYVIERLEGAGVEVVSEEIIFRNRVGKKIIGYYDYFKEIDYGLENNLIILPPAYGETKRDSLSMSYYLVNNGFRVIRYDASDHIGESEGDVADISMEKMKNDILSCIDFCVGKFAYKSVGVVATSVSFRVAIKATAQDKRIGFLLGLVGVVNLQDTLREVYNEDMIGDVQRGRMQEVYDVLGYPVKKEFFLSAIDCNYHNFQSTLKDVKNIDIPVVLLNAENDVWVDIKDVEMLVLLSKSDKISMQNVANAMHQLFENPKAARYAMKQMVHFCCKYLNKENIKLAEIRIPSIRQIARQNRIEKNRFKKARKITLEDEKEFWSQYMVDFALIKKVEDYRIFLDLIINLLGEYHRGEMFLDAGCGGGYVGVWLCMHLLYRYSKEVFCENENPFLHYFGIDFIADNIKNAEHNHRSIIKELPGEGKKSFVDFSYSLVDLNEKLDYTDDYFDKICCTLVISYLNDPEACIRELFRILKPGGKLVVTTLKPYADLSQIYRNFLAVAKNAEEVVEVRKLLSNAGQIKRKEGEGYYQFFSEIDLQKMMKRISAKEINVCRSFGNQANVILVSK